MISKKEINALNYSLAVKFCICQILQHGHKRVMEDIDRQVTSPHSRVYYRSLIREAVKQMKSCNIEVIE